MTDCAFCQIRDGELPAAVLKRWDDAIAIRPRDPARKHFPPQDSDFQDDRIMVIPREHAPHAFQRADLAGVAAMRCAELANALGWTDGHIAINIGPWGGQSIDHIHAHGLPADQDCQHIMPWFGEHLRRGVTYFTTHHGGFRLWKRPAGPAGVPTPVVYKFALDRYDPILWPMIMAVLKPTPLYE